MATLMVMFLDVRTGPMNCTTDPLLAAMRLCGVHTTTPHGRRGHTAHGAFHRHQPTVGGSVGNRHRTQRHPPNWLDCRRDRGPKGRRVWPVPLPSRRSTRSFLGPPWALDFDGKFGLLRSPRRCRKHVWRRASRRSLALRGPCWTDGRMVDAGRNHRHRRRLRRRPWRFDARRTHSHQEASLASAWATPCAEA